MTENDRLIEAYFDGSIGEADAASLGRWIKADPAHSRRFVALASFHASLLDRLAVIVRDTEPVVNARTVTQADRDPAAPTQSIPIYLPGCEPKPSRFRPRHYALGFAAALLVAGIAVVIVSAVAEHNRQAEIEKRQTELAERRAAEPVATLIESTGGNLTTPTGYPAEGSSFGRGEYTLDTGSAEFMLTNAVNVKLRGETRLHMRNNMNVALARGSAEFVCPKDATGFTVHLPGASRIVDLGTAFSVSIGPNGRAIVEVIDGAVRVDHADGSTHTLTFGQRAAVTEAGIDTSVTSLADAYAIAVLADRPLGYWPLNEQEPSGEVADRSGNGYAGQPTNIRVVRGPFTDETAFGFDGTSHVNIGRHPEFSSGKAYSIEAWVRIEPATDEAAYFHTVMAALEVGSPNLGGWALGFESKKRQLLLAHHRRSQSTIEKDRLEIGRWMHLAVVFDASHIAHWHVNGKRVGSFDHHAPRQADDASVSIGRYADGFGAWVGGLAHVAYYDHELTQERISAHYRAGRLSSEQP